VLQVTPDAQLGTGLQPTQLSGGPATLYRPTAQPLHCEVPALVQTRLEEQPATDVHVVQVRFVALVHAVAS
jgi:hypothetical protein